MYINHMLFNQAAFREAVINAFVHNAWIDGNAPMFTAFKDRIEIESMGPLPPKQTREGFFRGRSIPVNMKLSEIFVQLHISEKSGRGVPRIVEVYGREVFEFTDNSIIVTIPFSRLDLGYTPQVTPKLQRKMELEMLKRSVKEYLHFVQKRKAHRRYSPILD